MIVSMQDFWLSLLHKRLLGTKVLAVHRAYYLPEMVRIFAHCTNTKAGYTQGAISFMAINLHPKRRAEITFSESLQGLGLEEYLFTPEESITSRKIRLNGKLLEMGVDSSFPVFQPNPVPPGDPLILPPLTYAFYVVPEANALACLEP
ncbi:inactive heparanase-2-like [Orbicella faveolata]|uniref:inactive heparanase-2-like n=1 Tax=Orbicella faveolata TaxID=48498 RepID=UPI0009E241A8|nr:inactive heparanase-2-like [Orbicella faveolata]